MSRPPRLMYLITSSGTGGAERQVHDLALRMHAREWEVRVVSMLPLEATFADLPGAGVPTASLGMSRGVPDPRGLVRLQALLRDHRPDVLHAHMVHANLLARSSRLLRRTPVVICTMHSQHQGSRFRMAAYRATDRLCDETTAVSEVARRDAVRHGAVAESRVGTIPNGVDLSAYGPDDAKRERLRRELGLGNKFVFIAVGRIFAAKDYPNLIAACARLDGAADRSRVLIVGGGEQRDLKSLIDEAGLDERVRLVGERSDVADLMRAADAYVMSSAWEGLPMVLLEAGASGLPIVATAVGGNREIVEDLVTGFVVPPRDPGALAAGMSRLMEMPPSERSAMGHRGRELVERMFDIEAVAGRWDRLYRGLLARLMAGQQSP